VEKVHDQLTDETRRPFVYVPEVTDNQLRQSRLMIESFNRNTARHKKSLELTEHIAAAGRISRVSQ
jgi:hypothetical protein